MKANHNCALAAVSTSEVVANISCSKNESKSQPRVTDQLTMDVVANISCSKNESKSQLAPSWLFHIDVVANISCSKNESKSQHVLIPGVPPNLF